MNIVNLTPHELNIHVGEEIRVIPSSGVARANETVTSSDKDVDGIALNLVSYGEVVNLPEETENVIYVVSVLTALSLRATGVNRNDVYFVGELVRNEKGMVIGCKSLQRLA